MFLCIFMQSKMCTCKIVEKETEDDPIKGYFKVNVLKIFKYSDGVITLFPFNGTCCSKIEEGHSEEK